MSVLLLVSATAEDTERLVANGPRRDFLELAAETGATVMYRDGSNKPKGLRGKLLGPHVRQAWTAARQAEPGDVLFADGEHNGLPLVLFLALLRRDSPAVFLGHYVSKKWKRRAIRVASFLKRDVTLVVHSVVQQRSAERASGGRWAIALVPYQVDTQFWSRDKVALSATVGQRRQIVAAGSEHRDYPTLIEAVRGLDVDLTIATGSHWARETAGAGDLPSNVTLFTEPLSYADLRDLYAAADAVVMPLEDVPNQSGITGMLEAMAMGAPLIVTASKGQRECASGPLVRETGTMQRAMAARGPQLFGATTFASPNGVYAVPGEVASMRRAISLVLEDASFARAIAANGRETAEQVFSLETFTSNLASIIAAAGAAE